jgi:hypothetical protein
MHPQDVHEKAQLLIPGRWMSFGRGSLIGFKIILLARLEGGGCIAIRRRPITQSKGIILKPIGFAEPAE